jgi:hypothetical protein
VEGSKRRFCGGCKAAILVVVDFYDAEDLFGAWNLYKAIESKSKNAPNRIVMGQVARILGHERLDKQR